MTAVLIFLPTLNRKNHQSDKFFIILHPPSNSLTLLSYPVNIKCIFILVMARGLILSLVYMTTVCACGIQPSIKLRLYVVACAIKFLEQYIMKMISLEKYFFFHGINKAFNRKNFHCHFGG